MDIEKTIREKGPILSGELIALIRQQSSGVVSDEAIRKRLTRLSPDISRVKGCFAQKQALYFDHGVHSTEEYFDGLRAALRSAGKQYAYLLEALEFHYGSLPITQLAAYGVNPQSDTAGHLTFDTAIQRLRELSLITQFGDTVHLNQMLMLKTPNERHSRAVQLAKDVLLLQFNDWAKKIGLVSYNTATFYTTFRNYTFALVGPSYVATLTGYKDGKVLPGFLVADVLVGNQVTIEAAEFFVKKLDILKTAKALRPFLAFLLVDGAEPEALALLKSKGVIVGFVNQLFGPQYQKLLNMLIKEVTNAGAMLKKSPETFIKLLQQLTSLVSGKTNNLRGDLLEMAVGYYHSKMGCGTLDIGKKIFTESGDREMDIFAVYGDKVIVAECKAYNYPISKADVESWTSDKIPVIRNWILANNTYADKAIVFQHWSTGGYDESAWELINRIEPKTKKHRLEFFDQERILERSRQAKSTKFTELLEEYFIKPPELSEKLYEGAVPDSPRGQKVVKKANGKKLFGAEAP